MNSLAKVWTIVRKDVALQTRSREMLSSMVIFALIVILMFSFSFELRGGTTSLVAPGVLWTTFIFAGMLGLGRSFILESDQGCLDGLLLCPVDRSSIYFGKMLGNLIFISATEVIILPLYLALFNLPFTPLLVPIILLGTVGFCSVGTLISAMTVHIRARELMLPILLLPTMMPALIAAVKLTAGALDPRPWSEIQRWLQLLIGFDALYLAASFAVFDFVVED
jgi:heme exporter protein B